MGSGDNGVESIKNHKAFKNIDWVKLLAKELTPPYIPNIEIGGVRLKNLDCFDKLFTDETLEHSIQEIVYMDNKDEQDEFQKQWKLFKNYPSLDIPWICERIIWIAYKKNEDNDECLLAQMPKDIFQLILSFVKN